MQGVRKRRELQVALELLKEFQSCCVFSFQLILLLRHFRICPFLRKEQEEGERKSDVSV